MLGMIHPLFGQDGGAAGPSDSYWSSVVLLVGAEESSATIIDASKYRRGFRKSGNAAVSATQKKFGTRGIYNDNAATGVFSTNDTSAFTLGSGQWTFEGWVYSTGSGNKTIFAQRNGSGSMSGAAWSCTLLSATGKLEFQYNIGGSTTTITGTTTLSTTTWYHVAVDRDGTGKVRLYLNGVMDGSSSAAGSIDDSTHAVSIGATGDGLNQWGGYLDELRLTVGTARYASDSGFTAPTAAFPRVAVSSSTAAIVQSATLRNDGTIALGSSPTVGNLMVLMTAGYGVSLSGYVPAGFTAVDTFNSDGNNAVRCWTRVVQSGDTGSYSISASDNQAAVLYEFSGAGGVHPMAGGAMSGFFTGSSFSIPLAALTYTANDVILAAFEQDTTVTWTITGETGVTSDLVTTGATNHTSAFVHINPSTFDGTLAGSTSSAPTQPVYGQFVVTGAPI